jgi:hypothetical protein
MSFSIDERFIGSLISNCQRCVFVAVALLPRRVLHTFGVVCLVPMNDG